MLPIAPAAWGILLLVVSLNAAIASAVSPGVLENLIRYFSKQLMSPQKLFEMLWKEFPAAKTPQSNFRNRFPKPSAVLFKSNFNQSNNNKKICRVYCENLL